MARGPANFIRDFQDASKSIFFVYYRYRTCLNYIYISLYKFIVYTHVNLPKAPFSNKAKIVVNTFFIEFIYKVAIIRLVCTVRIPLVSQPQQKV
jgi:hypothetical protein